MKEGFRRSNVYTDNSTRIPIFFMYQQRKRVLRITLAQLTLHTHNPTATQHSTATDVNSMTTTLKKTHRTVHAVMVFVAKIISSRSVTRILAQLLRGTVVKRTYVEHKKLYSSLLVQAIFGTR